MMTEKERETETKMDTEKERSIYTFIHFSISDASSHYLSALGHLGEEPVMALLTETR